MTTKRGEDRCHTLSGDELESTPDVLLSETEFLPPFGLDVIYQPAINMNTRNQLIFFDPCSIDFLSFAYLQRCTILYLDDF